MYKTRTREAQKNTDRQKDKICHKKCSRALKGEKKTKEKGLLNNNGNFDQKN